MKFKDF